MAKHRDESILYDWSSGECLEGENRGKHVSSSVVSLVATSFLFIWKNSSEIKYSNRHSHPLTIWFKVVSSLESNDSQPQLPEDIPPPTFSPEEQGSNTSLDHSCNVFCDGSFLTSMSDAGTGCCSVDQQGTTIFECSNVHQAACALQAEIWAIWERLVKAAHDCSMEFQKHLCRYFPSGQ